MSLELAILGFLEERPRSGYELKTRCFTGPVGTFWGADQAQIYRTLDRLGRDKLVSARRKKQEGRPDRKVYEITHSGRETLYGLLATPAPLTPLRDAFLVQLYFAHRLDDDALLGVLAARRTEYQARLDELLVHSGDLAADHTLGPRDAVLRHTALDGAVALHRAAIEWLDDCVEAVRAGALPGSTSGGIGQRHLFGG